MRNVVTVDFSNAWFSKSGKVFDEGQKIDPKELPWTTRIWSWLFYSSRGEWRVQRGEPRFGLWDPKKHMLKIATYREPEELMVDQDVGFSILNEATRYAEARAEVEGLDKPPTSSKICDGCGESLLGDWASGNAECYDRKDKWIGHRHKFTSCRVKTTRLANERAEASANTLVKDLVRAYGHATFVWDDD